MLSCGRKHNSFERNSSEYGDSADTFNFTSREDKGPPPSRLFVRSAVGQCGVVRFNITMHRRCVRAVCVNLSYCSSHVDENYSKVERTG
jgi:hypothetical protein